MRVSASDRAAVPAALWTIAAFRAFGGCVIWLAPDLTARAYARQGPMDGGSRLISRLAGARELALALGPLLADGEDRRRWLGLGLGCDAADATATLIGRRRGELAPRSAAACAATYAASIALTACALRATAR